LFELYDEKTPNIRLVKREVPKIPDLSRFKNLDQLIVMNANLVELHSSIGKLDKLEYLILADNRIKTLPREIGSLRNVEFINLVGNPVTDFPEEIKYLDRSMGGKLERIGVSADLIGAKNLKRLRELLPTTDINENEK
jgi:Leucine-rich repeat (LRR) protein